MFGQRSNIIFKCCIQLNGTTCSCQPIPKLCLNFTLINRIRRSFDFTFPIIIIIGICNSTTVSIIGVVTSPNINGYISGKGIIPHIRLGRNNDHSDFNTTFKCIYPNGNNTAQIQAASDTSTALKSACTNGSNIAQINFATNIGVWKALEPMETIWLQPVIVVKLVQP